jgi:hypothetical protein
MTRRDIRWEPFGEPLKDMGELKNHTLRECRALKIQAPTDLR